MLLNVTNSITKTILVVCLIIISTIIGRTNPSTSSQLVNTTPTATPVVVKKYVISSEQVDACRAVEKKYQAIRRQSQQSRAGDPTKVVQLSSRFGLDINQRKTVYASAYHLPGNQCSNGEYFTEGWSIAVDMYSPAFKPGTIIRIQAKNPKRWGYVNGWGKVTDCGDFAYMGRTLDLGMTSYDTAINWEVDQVIVTHVIPSGMLTKEQENWLKTNCPFQKKSK